MAGTVATIIRAERPDDQAAIFDITQRAFAPMPFAAGDEQELINKLRDSGNLTISLVAEQEGTVLGHIAFSPAFASDGEDGWYALGPVAVEPELQRTGIGSALITNGLKILQESNAAGCVLTGNPDYYSRFGFVPAPKLAPEDEPAEYFQILPLASKKPVAVIDFHPLFKN